MADFIKLNEDKFRNLLTDIYSLYSPKHLPKIDTIVEDYGATSVRQMNAIKTVYIIYNRPGHINYDSNMVGTEQTVIKLMQEYSTGERTLSQENLNHQQEAERKAAQEAEEASRKEREDAEEVSRKERQEAEEVARKEKEEAEKNIKDKESLAEASRIEAEKEKSKLLELTGNQSEEFDNMKREVQGYMELLEQQKEAQMNAEPKISVFENMNIEVMGDTENASLPNEKFLATLCIGQRIIAPDINGEGVVGLEVVNMHDDYMSDPERPNRIIEFKRV